MIQQMDNSLEHLNLKARLLLKEATNKYVPKLQPKQLEFFNLDCKEALYGGSAGSGKSIALIACALKYVHIPGYNALLLRRNYPQLTQSGGLIDVSKKILKQYPEVIWSSGEKTWNFPSGATLKFGHMQNEDDYYQYQGGEWQFIGFDELTQYTEVQYRYLFSRNRGPKAVKVPHIIRSASNPGGIGGMWVKKRFIDKKVQRDEEKPVFIPAKLKDNKYLDHDEYKKALMKLDPITRAQLLEGKWIINTTGLIYPTTEENYLEEMPPLPGNRMNVLAIDLGASQTKKTTAFLIASWSQYIKDVVYISESFKRAGLTTTDIAQIIKSLQEKYEFDKIVMDQGALGVGYIEEIKTRYGIPVDPVQKKNKLGYRRLLADALETNQIYIINKTNEELNKEITTLPWNAKGTDAHEGFDDHCTDALLYAFREAKAYWSDEDEPEPPPTHGSKEYFDQLDREMEEKELELFSNNNDTWWKA